MGLQLVGPAFSENRILSAAHALEQAIGFDPVPPALRAAARMSRADWEPVIGLEIHVQLNTETKMFCACENRFGAEPNTLTCPLCLGHPGVLPVINQAAVDKAIQIGLALDCEIAAAAQFHRKNYFYPDSPKAYQITPVRPADLRAAASWSSTAVGSGSPAPTWRRTPPSSCTPAARAAASRGPILRWSTSTAAALRWSRS